MFWPSPLEILLDHVVLPMCLFFKLICVHVQNKQLFCLKSLAGIYARLMKSS